MPALHWPHPALWLIPLAMLAAFIPLQLYILKNNKKRGIAEPTVKIPDWLKKTTQVTREHWLVPILLGIVIAPFYQAILALAMTALLIAGISITLYILWNFFFGCTRTHLH